MKKKKKSFGIFLLEMKKLKKTQNPTAPALNRSRLLSKKRRRVAPWCSLCQQLLPHTQTVSSSLSFSLSLSSSSSSL